MCGGHLSPSVNLIFSGTFVTTINVVLLQTISNSAQPEFMESTTHAVLHWVCVIQEIIVKIINEYT